VKGPRSELKQLRFIESDPIDLSDIVETQSVTLALRSPGNQSSLITKTVSVKVGINEVPRQRTFEHRPVELRTSPNVSDIGIEPVEVTVVVEGPPTVVAEVDPSDVVPYIRVREAPPKEGRVIDVSVDLPEGCSALKVEPSSVFVFNESARKTAMRSRAEKITKKGAK